MSVNKMIGTAQDGLLAMSSNVAFGEKNTPMIRPIELIAGWDCASGAGKDAVVAIEVPPPQAAPLPAHITAVLPRITPKHQKNFITVGAQLLSRAQPRERCAPARDPPCVLSRSVFSFSAPQDAYTCPQPRHLATTLECGSLATAFTPATSLSRNRGPSTRRSAALSRAPPRQRCAPVRHDFKSNANWIMPEAIQAPRQATPACKDAPAG